MVLCVLSMSAQKNVTVTLNIDHADRIRVEYYDASWTEVEVEGLVDGDNTLKVPVGDYPKTVNIYAKDGYGLKSCTCLDAGKTETGSREIWNMTKSDFEASADGAVWTIETFDFEEERTATALFNVDKASKVKVRRINTDTDVNLSDGDNNVAFIPADGDNANESQFSIESTDWERPLYSVLLNGEEIDGYSPNNTTVTLKDGDNVTIKADYPDIDVPVKFNYTDGAFGIVTKVEADGDELAFDGYSVNVKCGSKVEFTYDNDNYILNSISINGIKDEYPWSPMSLGIVTEEITIDIDATKIGGYHINVNVNDADYVKLLAFENGSSIYYGGVEVPLVSGENNDIEISDKRHFFSIEDKTRSKLVELSLNGNKIEQVEKTDDWSGEKYLEWPFPIELKEGDVLEITGSGPARDNTAVIFIDKIPEGEYSFDFNMNGFKPGLKEGYNIVKFDDNKDSEIGDLPFNIELMYNSVKSWLYLDNETVEPIYHDDSSDYYTIEKAGDNSVIKLFTQEAPQTYAVTFTTEDVSADKIKVLKDYVTEISNPDNGFEALGFTAVTIATTDDSVDIEVTADGETVNGSEEGSYLINITAPVSIHVKGNNSGVSVPVKDKSFDIYNLQGICLMRSAGADCLHTLPAGIYIINGRKVKI